jgi:hydrogenase-4 membrane subunit HyfE
MSPLLMGLLGVMVVPLFVATWRSSLFGLSCQGFLIAWAAYRLKPELHSLETWLTLADLLLVRGIGAPLLLYRLLLSQNRAARHDIIAPNLLSWTVALGLVLAAFNLSAALVPVDGDQRALISVAAAAVLLGFLVLASQSTPFGQVVGALQLENGVALFELGGARHHGSLVTHVGQIAIVAGTLGLYLWLLRGFSEGGSGQPAASPQDEPTL